MGPSDRTRSLLVTTAEVSVADIAFKASNSSSVSSSLSSSQPSRDAICKQQCSIPYRYPPVAGLSYPIQIPHQGCLLYCQVHWQRGKEDPRCTLCCGNGSDRSWAALAAVVDTSDAPSLCKERQDCQTAVIAPCGSGQESSQVCES